jgi:Domain of unknown function (DUF1707)/Cell wall-active antibiotics response 4TMS YvqF
MDEAAPSLRASDSERDDVVLALRDAVVQGRLTLEEFTDRVGDAHTARTYAELDALTRDLPAPGRKLAKIPVRSSHRAICSVLVRRGPFEVPESSSATAICGTMELDLRQARIRSAEAELRILNVFGTVSVIVPDGVLVTVEGGGLFSSERVDGFSSARSRERRSSAFTSPAPAARSTCARRKATGPAGFGPRVIDERRCHTASSCPAPPIWSRALRCSTSGSSAA